MDNQLHNGTCLPEAYEQAMEAFAVAGKVRWEGGIRANNEEHRAAIQKARNLDKVEAKKVIPKKNGAQLPLTREVLEAFARDSVKWNHGVIPESPDMLHWYKTTAARAVLHSWARKVDSIIITCVSLLQTERF